MGNEASRHHSYHNSRHNHDKSKQSNIKEMVHKLRDNLAVQQKHTFGDDNHNSDNMESRKNYSEGKPNKDLARSEQLKSLKAPSQKNLIEDDIERFDNIYSEPLDIDGEFMAPEHPKSESQKNFIREAILGCLVFSHLNESEMKTLVSSMEKLTVSKDTKIIARGEAAHYFYILESGTVTFTVDGIDVGEGKRGETFGELALLYNCMRTATCQAIEDCSLWRVNRDTFKQIIAGSRKRKVEQTVSNLKSVNLFKDLNDEMLHKINDTLIQQRYKAGEIIIQKGKEGKTFYIIDKGAVAVTDIGLTGSSQHSDHDLGPGEFFGERALMTGDVRSATVFAVEDDTVLLCMDRDDFIKILGPLDQLIKKIQQKQTLLSIPVIANAKISHEDKARLLPLLNEVKLNKGDVVYEPGQWIRPTLYIITSGSIEKIFKDGTSTILRKEDYFGDETFDKGRRVVESQYCIKVLEDNTTCEVLTLNAIQIVLRTLSKVITGKNVRDSIHLESCLTFERLKKHKMLGAGSFGRVWLVSDTMSGATYALKLMSKRRIIKCHQWKSVIREKEIMSMVDHPFILKMVNAFQDDTFVCMVMELYLGGELFTVLHSPENKRGLKEKSAAFYAACVVEAFGYLHQRQIVYRDLKPENLLLDAHGYLVVIDLGFAKVVKNKTFTVCGTPLYIAPEIILERGHDRAADIWSLGVLIYELLAGKTPFYSKDIGKTKLFERICMGSYAFIKGKFSEDAKDLIGRILVLRPTTRLGCLAKGDADIRQHPWFKDIDFGLLPRKKVDPPFVPTIKDRMDSSNFEDWSEMEHEYDDEKPPSGLEQKYFKEF